MKINGEGLRQFRKDFMETVVPLEEKYGVVISIDGKIRYGDNDFRMNISVTNGEKEETERKKFEETAILFGGFGIRKEMFRQEFKALNGKTYILTGLNARAPKNMCIVEEKGTGKAYSCGTEFLGIKQNNSGVNRRGCVMQPLF